MISKISLNIMDRCIKYEQVSCVWLFGEDNSLQSAASSVSQTSYSSYTYTNGQILRFSLNGAWTRIEVSNHVELE